MSNLLNNWKYIHPSIQTNNNQAEGRSLWVDILCDQQRSIWILGWSFSFFRLNCNSKHRLLLSDMQPPLLLYQSLCFFFIKLNFSTIISICTYLFTVMISAGVSGPWTWVSAHKEAVNECVQATAAVRQWRWTYKHGCLAVMTLYTDLMIPTLHRNLWGRHNYSPTLFGVDCRKNWRLLLKLSNIEWW